MPRVHGVPEDRKPGSPQGVRVCAVRYDERRFRDHRDLDVPILQEYRIEQVDGVGIPDPQRATQRDVHRHDRRQHDGAFQVDTELLLVSVCRNANSERGIAQDLSLDQEPPGVGLKRSIERPEAQAPGEQRVDSRIGAMDLAEGGNFDHHHVLEAYAFRDGVDGRGCEADLLTIHGQGVEGRPRR